MKEKITLIIIALLTISSIESNGQGLEMRKEASWTNVTNVSVNESENYMVLTMRNNDGSIRLYQSFKTGDAWSQPESLDNINAKVTSNTQIGGLFLMDNERRLYFHANFADGIGGFDIYYSDKNNDTWSAPKLLNDINTTADELSPSLSQGEQTIYFLRHQPLADLKLEKKQANKMSIYSSSIDAEGKWKTPQPINNAINRGDVQSLTLANDAKTLLYSIRQAKNDPAIMMYARELASNIWQIPEPVFLDESGCNYFSSKISGSRIYTIRSSDRKANTGLIVSVSIPDDVTPQKTICERSTIVTKSEHKPINAEIIVLNPTTSAIIGRYTSDELGAFCMTNLADASYIVDIRCNGYSVDTRTINYRQNPQPQMPKQIELFDTIQLVVNVYDSEMFRQLNAGISAVRVNDKKIFKPNISTEGRYTFALPLGSNYNIISSAKNYDENSFIFKTEGDIIFSRFERDLPLTSKKQSVTVYVVDAETKTPLNANVIVDNLSRDEHINITKEQMQNGTINLTLRDNDKYNIMIEGNDRYFYFNRIVDLSQKISNVNANLIPLKINASISLCNISFAATTAAMTTESYIELDNFAEMLKNTPKVKIEIVAHTDNVGNAQRNKRLSELRANAVATYLTERGISQNRLVATGAGSSRPIAPNDTEANRAANNRIEFKIISVE